VAGWGSDGTPTCVATGSIDGTGSASKLTYWTDANTLGYGTGSTSVQHQGSLSVTQDLSASGILYVLGKLSDSTGFGTSGQVLTVNGSGYPRWTTPSAGDITGITTTSPLSGGCTSGTCALTTSMSTARILGRTTASTGVVEQLTGTQATAMLDAFTSALKGLVPASGGGTTKFLRADATWQVPPDDDHALTTSNAIPKGNGTTQVASLLTDDGATVMNAGDTDLTAGTTTVGRVDGVVQSGNLSGEITLGADTAVLLTSSAASTITGLTGGSDGRMVTVCSISTVAANVTIAHESGSATLANRFLGGGGGNRIMRDRSCFDFVYVGSLSRWVYTASDVLQSVTTVGAASIGGTTTTNGLVSNNGTIYSNMNTSAPASSAIEARSNGSVGGFVSLVPLGTDNVHLAFDASYSSSTWTAQDTSWASIAKQGDELKFLFGTGATDGSSIATAYAAALAAPTMRLGADYVDMEGTLAFSGTDPTVSCTSGAAVITGEAQTFEVIVTTEVPSGATCTVTFQRTFDSAPYCVASPVNNVAIDSLTATTTTMTFSPSVTANPAIGWNFFCPDRR